MHQNDSIFKVERFCTEYPPHKLTKTTLRKSHWCNFHDGISNFRKKVTLWLDRPMNQCLINHHDPNYSGTLQPSHHPKDPCTSSLIPACCIVFPTVKFLDLVEI